MGRAPNFGPVGIIDIGSNSVRLVAYAGSERVPSALYNEKVMAGLGRTTGEDGELSEEAMAAALDTLKRFRPIIKEMGLIRVRAVATAAVRDAPNGDEFLRQVRKLGLKPRILSGVEEATMAARGVLSGIPWAKGVVADLGGGSLELAGVARGAVGEGVSMPLGVLKVGPEPDREKLLADIEAGIAGTRLHSAAKGNTLYLVGGSFRALAQLEMELIEHPLPIAHEYRLHADQLGPLGDYVEVSKKREIKEYDRVSNQRIPHLPAAIAILETLIEVLEPKKVIVSAYGLREGLLYADLDERVRGQDPLMAAAFEIGHKLGRFGDHGALLDRWIAPLFPGDPAKLARLRRAACLLADIAWNAHPDFRAERALDLATHGNWVGINARGRAILGRALFIAFGGDPSTPSPYDALMKDGDAERAHHWGRAIRLAQRFSAGTAKPLRKSELSLEDGKIVMSLAKRREALYSPAVEKRHHQLADAMGMEADLRLD
ncbi:Ppx/GppA phosphatase family protein [Sphingomicrobium clamense]|uniref:Ppx/GppA family phosphatase n=1 Tax=Sphingomicrobium clamense TaxID=2851013 RepID=A0ABS6V623_9SPHN|nr:Ppx/GppA phosphatase family protein [Sphingomicrobium sp. B8]MBW0144991.1 Ppx/GppA family phosphatase [Sphingomicrobium sp. B8]